MRQLQQQNWFNARRQSGQGNSSSSSSKKINYRLSQVIAEGLDFNLGGWGRSYLHE